MDDESIDIEMERVMPAEVQIGAKLSRDEEVLQAPPSYDISAPLLGDDGTDNERFTTDSTTHDNEGKAAPAYSVWLGPFAFLAWLILFLSPMGFMMMVHRTKADLLGFSLLAYLLLFAVLLAPVILAIVVSISRMRCLTSRAF